MAHQQDLMQLNINPVIHHVCILKLVPCTGELLLYTYRLYRPINIVFPGYLSQLTKTCAQVFF